MGNEQRIKDFGMISLKWVSIPQLFPQGSRIYAEEQKTVRTRGNFKSFPYTTDRCTYDLTVRLQQHVQKLWKLTPDKVLPQA